MFHDQWRVPTYLIPKIMTKLMSFKSFQGWPDFLNAKLKKIALQILGPNALTDYANVDLEKFSMLKATNV